MSGISLNCYQNVAFYDETSLPKIDHSLGRRMTPLQRALLFACRCLFAENRPCFEDFFTDRRNVIFLATGFGEVSANLAVINDIRQQRFPVSPKDFQHSIYNAALGYLAIVEKTNLHMMAITSGFLSIDKALQLATMRIEAGTPKILVLCADENMQRVDILARAEAFLLSKSPNVLLEHQFEIDNFIQGKGAPIASSHSKKTIEHRQSLENGYCFLDPQYGQEDYTRLSIAASGEWVQSSWKRVSCKL